jgi:capsular exopolysaccharide synthesis family protein
MQPKRLFTRHSHLLETSEIETEAHQLFVDDGEPLIDFARYYRILRKRQRIIIAFTIVVMIMAVVHIISTRPVYTAETTVMLSPATGEGSSTLANLVEIETAAYTAEQYYKTQSELLESPTIAADVIRHLGLMHRPTFIEDESNGPFARLSSAINGAILGQFGARQPPMDSVSAAANTSGVRPAVVHRYLAMLTVALVPETDLLKISFATHDARLSAELANAHVEGYERQQNVIRFDQNDAARQFLQSKLLDIREQLENSEAALNDYRRRKGIIPGLITLDGKNAVVLDRLSDLSKNLTNAQVDRIGLEAQVSIIRKHDYNSLPSVAQNIDIQTLRKELNDLHVQEAALSGEFKADYPRVAKLRSQISEVEGQLDAAIGKVVAEIRSSYAAALEKENELQAEIDRQRAATLDLNDAAAQYAILQREVDTNRELYNAVLTRMKDVAVTSGEPLNNVSVIVPAEVPTAPTSPRKARELMMALILGLSGGLGLAFTLDFFDNTLKNPEEAETYLREPILGIVPEFSLGQARSPGSGVPELITSRSLTSDDRELVTAHGSYSTIGECYRNFRTALLLSRAEHPPRTMLITSAISREGKTVTAVNIAAMLAQLGRKTVLVDGDLRRARCHRVLSIENHLGLTEVLTGTLGLHEVLRKTEIEHLDFVSSGAVPPNPTELLGSHKIAETLRYLAQDYEYVVIDSSPVLPVSDALLLARLVDGVVIVANTASTPRHQVRIACVRVDYAGGRILGIVLNRIKLHYPDYDPYYHGGYYYTVEDDGAKGNSQ